MAPRHVALIVNNFAIQYVGDAHLDHLCQALKKHYKVSEEIDGTRFAGTILKWNYSPIHAKYLCRLSMPGYIHKVCTRYRHLMPTKRQLPPHKHCEIIFGQTTQLTHVNPYSPPLSTEGVKRIQGIIGALLYYARAIDNKLLATLSTLSSQQATATEATDAAMNQLLNYLATYPDDGTTYRTGNMILCAHTDASLTTNQRAAVEMVPKSLSPKTTPSPSITDQCSQSPSNEICHVFCLQS
jgi:hypothetical protein